MKYSRILGYKTYFAQFVAATFGIVAMPDFCYATKDRNKV